LVASAARKRSATGAKELFELIGIHAVFGGQGESLE
jgi:hypothetical protein